MNDQPEILPLTGHVTMRSGGYAILTLTPASHHLIAHARVLAAEGRYQFALVFAHAACELHTEGELARLLDARSDQLLATLVLPDEWEVKSLANGKVQRLYSALTDDYPQGRKEPKTDPATWWNEWCVSRKIRHKVAHRGTQVSQEQAETAISLADQYIKHLTDKTEAALAKLKGSP